MYFSAKSEGAYHTRRTPVPKEPEVLMNMYMQAHFIASFKLLFEFFYRFL